MSVEVAAASALYGLGAMWLLWSIRSVFSFLPDLVSGLFGNEFEFVISWLVLLVVALLGYVIALLGYTSYTLLRNDPVGRGLSAVITATLTLTLFSDARTASMVVIALVSAACTVTMFLSPWARRALDGERRHGRPWPVVLSQTLAFSYFLLIGVIGVAFLPGLRFTGDVGGSLVVFVLLTIGASSAALLGARLLARGPDKVGRILISAACAAEVIAELAGGSGAGVLLTLGILAGAALPLWLAPSARAWFGDNPLSISA